MRIPQLPPWNLTNPLPAFHDYESLSAIDQTARLYGTMRGLIDDYNKFANEVNMKISEFVNDLNADQEQFKNEINKLVHDYIIALDMKIAHQDREIEESIVHIKDNLKQAVEDLIKEMGETGELEETIGNAFNNLGERILNLESKLQLFENSTINVKNYGVVGDGVTDDTEAIQAVIDNNPLKTIYFPAGRYLISSPIVIKQANSKLVNLQFDDFAILFSNTQIESLLNVGSDITAGSYTRYNSDYKSIKIEGGILDCENVTYGIKAYSKLQLVKYENIKFEKIKHYGIYIERDESVTSSNAKIMNCHFMGENSNSSNECCAIRLDGYDNELSELTIDRCKKGVYLNGGGNLLNNIHVTTVFDTTRELTTEEFNSTIGFHINGTNFLTQCYADTFGHSFYITADKYVSLTNCYTFYWTNTENSTAIAVDCDTDSPILNVTGCAFKLPTTGQNKYFKFKNPLFVDFINTYQQIELVNNFFPTNPSVSDEDIAFCLQLRKISGITPYYFGENMKANKYYPLAIIKKTNDLYEFNITNNGDIAYKIALRYGSDSSIVKNDKLYGYDRQYELAIINEYTIDDITYGILVISPKSDVINIVTISGVKTHGRTAIYAHKYPNHNPITVNSKQLSTLL